MPPEPGVHATFAREHEYKRYGTVSLLAGIDLVTGKVHALAKDRHRSREFIEFLELLDAAYPAQTAIKLILDNHSAHISRDQSLLAGQPVRIYFHSQARLLAQSRRGLLFQTRPLIGDTDLKVAKLYGTCRRDERRRLGTRTAADNQTFRIVFVIGPDKKIMLTRSIRDHRPQFR